MQLRPLGRTGLRVPPICLGTMTFGLQCDEATSFAILDRAFEGGVDFIDTASPYHNSLCIRRHFPYFPSVGETFAIFFRH